VYDKSDPIRSIMGVGGQKSADTFKLAYMTPASTSWQLSGQQVIRLTGSGTAPVPHNISLSLVVGSQTWALPATPPATSANLTTNVIVNLPSGASGYVIAKDMTIGNTVNSPPITFIPSVAGYQLSNVTSDPGPWVVGSSHRVSWNAYGTPAAGHTVAAYYTAASSQQVYTLCQNIPAAQGQCSFIANLPVGTGTMAAQDNVAHRTVYAPSPPAITTQKYLKF